MKIEPPKAEKIPFKHEIHGDVRIDNYYSTVQLKGSWKNYY